MVLLGGKFGEGVANQKAIPNLNPGWLFYIDFFIYLIIYLLIFSQWAEKSPLPLRFSPAPYPAADPADNRPQAPLRTSVEPYTRYIYFQ